MLEVPLSTHTTHPFGGSNTCQSHVFVQVVGMGLLLSFIGLHTSGIVVPDARTMVAMGDPFALEPMLAIGGLALIAALHYRNVRGSIIIGVLVTAIGYYVATASWPTQ